LKAEEIVLRKLTVAIVSAFILLVPAVPAQAAVSPAAAAAAANALRVRGERVVAAARAQRGKPYRFGATGPKAFDCSGLTGYVYRTVHIRLPRTAQQQYHAARPVGSAAARPGDLVFWLHGKHAYHVGVYAGGGRVWHAPKQGDRVKLARIWGRVHYGRVA
jgi:cell wall-associated NlpC family hydrolase